MSSRQIEMTWRCSACRTRNLGRHKSCPNCGKPKDASERYEMPSNTAEAASITDPALLAAATAGPDWECRYCQSHQRRLDGSCGQCGADQTSGRRVPVGGGALPVAQPIRPAWLARSVNGPYAWGAVRMRTAAIAFGAMALALVALIVVAVVRARPRELDARVSARSWTHVVYVERWQIWQREGFEEQRPASAFEVSALGQRVHHHEQVLDHHETEHYTERVPDGFDTEHYSERVACGEDCTESAPSCHEVCTPNDNGFASCQQVCTSGGRSCTTRHCDEQRSRQVPRFRDEPRSREVPRYRSEPRHAEWYRYKVWDWGHNRKVALSGTGEPPRWPSDAELKPSAALADGEKERTRREAAYQVTLTDPEGRRYEHVPADEAALARFALDSLHRLRVERSGQWAFVAASAP